MGRETEILGDGELEQIFAQQGLTLYLSGHHHGFYPGASGGVRQAGVACLGDGPRALVGTTPLTPRALLRLEVQGGALGGLDALESPDFVKTIGRSSLPAALVHGSHQLTRDDLAGF